MGLVINKQQGNSGRTPTNLGFYSGLMVYGTSPSVTGKWASYSSSLFPSVVIKAQQLFGLSDAIDAGILPNTDNTASTGSIAWGTGSSLGTLAAGDIITITRDVITVGGSTSTITLCAYTVISADVSDTTGVTLAAAITAAINASTYLTGFSSTQAITNVSNIAAPKLYGTWLNTKSVIISISNSHTMTNTNTAFSSGTASQFAIWYYQISRFFAKNPTGVLWVGIISSTSSGHEILALQSAASNNLRQIGVYDKVAVSTNMIANCLAFQNAALLIDQTFPTEIVYAPNISAITDMSLTTTMPNGQSVAYNKVRVVISQDGGAQGAFLYTVSGQSIGNVGDKLGTLSSSRISSDDSQAIEQFNLSDGIENNIPAFANGQLLSSISAGLQTQLQNYRYIFFQTYTGNVVGTFWTDNYCFCVQTNRYAYDNDNRVASEVTRILNSVYIPLLKSEVIYNPDGTISDMSIAVFQQAGVDGITAAMITGFGANPLISGAPIVTIDPTQNLQATNNLIVVVKVGENGIARTITINQGFTN